jgi:DNA modification methylase
VIDPRNRLNDLSNREWLQETKSFWFSCTPPRSPLKATHPATFSERDIERLIRLFSKPGELVLDPFVGSGSTLLAARACGRRSLGLELIPEWVEVARQRLAEESPSDYADLSAEVQEGDARTLLAELPEDHVDFIVTSPPYWKILRKRPGLKAKAERVDRGLPTHYSENPQDLGNLQDYGEFLSALGEIFEACGRVLKSNKYLCVIVSDFRHGPRFVLYHADLAREIEARGLALKGLTILCQDNKSLWPFAIPFSFVSNIHHQYILMFQKPGPKLRRSGKC